MTRPIASVLIRVYNADAYLSEAVESALAQTEKNIEVVAVDDGSTDSSREILRHYAARDARVRVFEEAHKGLGATANRGLEVARGKYISILDADDIATQDRVEKQVKFLEEHEDYVLVGGQATIIGPEGETTGERRFPVAHEAIEAELRASCCFVNSSVTFRRAEILNAGGYDALFAPAEDYDLWVRLAAKYRLANLSDVVCRYRVHQSQVSSSQALQQYLAAMCIQAAFRGASREAIRASVQAEEKDLPRILRRLGYSDDEIAENLTGGFLYWTAALQSTGRLEPAFKLLTELKRHLSEMKCAPRYFAQAYSWEFMVSVAAHRYLRAARSLLLAFAASPLKTAKNILSRLPAPLNFVPTRAGLPRSG